MCTSGDWGDWAVAAQAGPGAQPLAIAKAALSWLAGAGAQSMTAAQLADALRGLEEAESALVAARSAVLARFDAQRGYEGDGHGSARSWLIWQTRISSGAAAAAIGTMRRLGAHPAVADALSAGDVSASWARQICEWTSLLPEGTCADADEILLGAAAGGARLADIAALAAELRRLTAAPDTDPDDGFADRSVRLDVHFGGAGKLDGDLTPRCAAALAAVLDSLAKKAGPEDVRTAAQRRHDALEEACRRLIASGCLPDRAGQPTQIQLVMTLDQLAGGAAAQPTAPPAPGPHPPPHTGPEPHPPPPHTGPGPHLRPSPRAGTGRQGGPAPPVGRGPYAAPGDDCDAVIVPIVTGSVDYDLLDQLARDLAAGRCGPSAGASSSEAASQPAQTGPPDKANRAASQPVGTGRPEGASQAAGTEPPGSDGQPELAAVMGRGEAAARTGQVTARELALSQAIALLSGPAGLASRLRRGRLTGPAATVSLPLDTGAATEIVPPHLRRAVIVRDRHCAFAGCEQPPAVCQVHHVIPRSQGGPTALTNLVLLCSFHHLTAVHRWGWAIALHADGTTTAISPDRSRVLNDQGPPRRAA